MKVAIGTIEELHIECDTVEQFGKAIAYCAANGWDISTFSQSGKWVEAARKVRKLDTHGEEKTIEGALTC